MELKKAVFEDCPLIHRMQVKAFSALYEKYRDDATSPAKETEERIREKFLQPYTGYFLIITDSGETAGAVRVTDRGDGSRKRISPIFILEEYRNRGLASAAIGELERLYGKDHWALDTILQEEGNCRLYERLGYRRTGKQQKINDRMDIVFYEKN